jgi:hypothetical protein
MKPSRPTYRQMAAARHESAWPETDEPLPDASDIRTAEGVAYDPSVYATPVGECEAMDEWREIVARDNDAREVLCPQCSRLHGHWSGGALYLWDHDEGGHVRVDGGPGAYVDARCKCGCEWRIER